MDQFAAGIRWLSIALLKVSIFLSVAMIGVVTLLLPVVGLFAGARLGEIFGKRMEILGGLILLGLEFAWSLPTLPMNMDECHVYV